MRPAIKFSIAAGVLIFIAVVLVALFYRPASPALGLPSPNGYADFVEATKVFVAGPDWRTLDVDGLRATVAQNAKALALVRVGLTKQCQVPIEYTMFYLTNNLPHLAEFKGLALGFVAEGKLAEKEGRPQDAIRSYQDCVRFGEESPRGGLLIDKLVGVACEAIGMEQLRTLLPSLDATDLQRVQKGLVELHRNPESPESVIQQERLLARRSVGTFSFLIRRLTIYRSLRQAEQRFREKCDRSETALRLMRTDVALRLYFIDKGAYPATLADLVPQYLEAVPIDPFSQQALIYKPQTNAYLLYSVGPDHTDDGGLSYRRAGGGKGDLTSTEP
jgi:hypothetical protein